MPSDSQWQRETTASDTTRYLCAATYLKRGLARKIRTEIVNEKHRALGPSGGVDTGAILRHAVAATTYQAVRDFGMLVAIILMFVGFGTNLPLLALIAVLVGWLIVGIHLYSIKYGVIVGKLQRGRFRPGDAPEPASDKLKERIDDIARHIDGNVTIYNTYSPFVGDGTIIKNWSTVVDLSKVKDENLVVPFDVAELHKAVTDDVRALELPGLRVADRLFVGGNAIRGDRRFLSDPLQRPNTLVDQRTIDECAANPENSCRHYTHIQITGWRGELVVSIFLRLVLFRRSLFVEANYTVLYPLPQECYEIDAIPARPTIGDLVRLAGRAAIQLPRAAWSPIPEVARLCWQPISAMHRDAVEERLIRSNLAYDYGATTTIRESAADDTYNRYFQWIDRQMNTKLIDKRIFNQIIRYLEDHNIDTGEIKRIQQFYTFGDVNGGTVAIGDHAMAMTTK